ncbi:unnamed protein product [Periconia digitata]|uniref:Uncharacterized protein n=1 Tax=Periconia digitata TaxID=1303443 RepID=A0A9W4URH6_9PLEO|nr:unnamed protein product [Periconia digitata]
MRPPACLQSMSLRTALRLATRDLGPPANIPIIMTCTFHRTCTYSLSSHSSTQTQFLLPSPHFIPRLSCSSLIFSCTHAAVACAICHPYMSYLGRFDTCGRVPESTKTMIYPYRGSTYYMHICPNSNSPFGSGSTRLENPFSPPPFFFSSSFSSFFFLSIWRGRNDAFKETVYPECAE